METRLKNIFLLLILLFLYVFICANSYVSAISNNISNSVLRLHVLANSDSEDDQALKLEVRDSLLEYMNSLCSNCKTKEDAIEIVMKNCWTNH